MKEKINLKQLPENVIISHTEKIEELLKVFKEQGPNKIHVLADFDRTLTNAFVNGEKITSIISILRKENILNQQYTDVTTALFDKYHPIEIDTSLPLVEKKAKMAEWWRAHNDELLKHGLTKDHLNKVLASLKIKFRDGSREFIDMMDKNHIPVIIMSSSGLGGYVISRLLKKQGRLYDNIKIISNNMIFNEAGKVIAFSEPVIHVFNKDETMVKDFPEVFAVVKDRPDVILLGDNIEDIGMVEGFAYNNLMKFGFLNEEVDKNLKAYKKNFDMVITNDGEMKFINQLIAEIL